MFRATTPKHTFYFDVDPEAMFKRILITYAQGDKIVMEKEKEDLTFEQTEETDCQGKTKTVYMASLRLSQEEANMFSAKSAVVLQIRVLTYGDEVVATEKMRIPVSDVLNDEVLV